MDSQTIKELVAEIAPLLTGLAPGKIFQLGPLSLAIDFRLRDGYLFLSVEPGLPRIHLIKRRVRDLEKQSIPSSQFALTLRKELSGTFLRAVEKDPEDRIARFRFAGSHELGERTLVAQLTGRSANLFLLDSRGVITHQLRAARGSGQQIGETYRSPDGRETSGRDRGNSPTVREGSISEPLELQRAGQFHSLSAALDHHYSALLSEQAFDARAAAARADLRKQISRQQKLIKQLHADLASHADADQQKRLGDLLLANLSTAERKRNRIKLIDYFAADARVIEIELDEKVSLPEEAERRFAIYSRSKRAVKQISSRIAGAQLELATLKEQQADLEKLIAHRDLSESPAGAGRTSTPPSRRGRKPEKKIPGVRRYVSSDGFEILVGRTSRDNDHLTFKIAKPNDLWLHAADYAGSHVVVRNPTRKPIPHRTLIEAAQLGAKFSRASQESKVDVHYTERKFVAKVKGAAPGLVRMSRFKNIIVAPKEGVARIP